MMGLRAQHCVARALGAARRRRVLAAPAVCLDPSHRILRRSTTGGAAASQPMRMMEQESVMPAAELARAVECLRRVDGWSDVRTSQLRQTVVTGGLTNALYKLTYLEESSQQVLVRIYGQGTDGLFDRDTEIAVFQALSSVGASPQCYGTFQGGRIEEFLVGKTLRHDEIKEQHRIEQLAAAVAEFHTSNPPIEGPRKNGLMDVIAKWLAVAKQRLVSDLSKQDMSIVTSSSFDFSPANLDKEYEVMKCIIATAKSPVAFVHHDLIAGNFIDVGDKVRLIDFEYSWYDNIAMDIGNHWVEWTVNYEYEGYPHYEIRHDKFPTDAQQRHFVTAYLTAAAAGGAVPTEQEITELVTEANMFAMAAHFMWACWGFMQAGRSTIEFGHVQYGRDRMEMYAECKRRFLATGRV